MTALTTCAEQILEFGMYKYSYTPNENSYVVGDNDIVEVYRIDKSTDAHVLRTGSGFVKKVSFVRA